MAVLALSNYEEVNRLIQKCKLEDYMRVIYMLLRNKGIARGADIAQYFGVTMSVSITAVQHIRMPERKSQKRKPRVHLSVKK